MPQPLLELGGKPDAPLIHLAPANGFVPQTYQYLTDHFKSSFRVVSLPPRALWGDGAPPDFDTIQDWAALADDLLAGIRQYGLTDMLAFGHSFGGIATLLAALKEPQHFRALVLLDPTILQPSILQMIAYAVESQQQALIPLVAGAQRRRTTYDSIDEAFENLRPKSVFADWSDEALRLYATYGTQATDEGTRTLTWSAAWEAYYYGTGYTKIWDVLPQMTRLQMPILFLAGGYSDTYIPESVAKVMTLVPNATHKTLEGYGHLFPQAAPDATATLIKQWLQDEGLL